MDVFVCAVSILIMLTVKFMCPDFDVWAVVAPYGMLLAYEALILICLKFTNLRETK